MLLKVFVKTGKKETKVEKTDKGYTVFLRSRPKQGEANQELVKNLAAYFSVSQTRVVLKSGFKSRYKSVEIL